MNVLPLVAVALLGVDSYQLQVLELVNEERENADLRELAIYGELLLGPRLPLEPHEGLRVSAQWWCDATKSSGLLAHGWYVNADGFLIASPTDPRILSKVWLPQVDGWHDFVIRNAYLGIHPNRQSENGVKASTLTAKRAVELWMASGYNDDPRKAIRHYSNLINPAWTHAGVGKAPSNGKKISFMEFAEFLDE